MQQNWQTQTSLKKWGLLQSQKQLRHQWKGVVGVLLASVVSSPGLLSFQVSQYESPSCLAALPTSRFSLRLEFLSLPPPRIPGFWSLPSFLVFLISFDYLYKYSFHISLQRLTTPTKMYTFIAGIPIDFFFFRDFIGGMLILAKEGERCLRKENEGRWKSGKSGRDEGIFAS